MLPVALDWLISEPRKILASIPQDKRGTPSRCAETILRIMSASPDLVDLPVFPVRDSPVSPPTTPSSSDAEPDEPADYLRRRDALAEHIPTESLSSVDAPNWMLNFQSLWVRSLSGQP